MAAEQHMTGDSNFKGVMSTQCCRPHSLPLHSPTLISLQGRAAPSVVNRAAQGRGPCRDEKASSGGV